MQKLNLNHLFLVLFLLVCECCLKEKSNCSSFLLDSRLSPWSTANVNVLHCFVFQNTWTKFLVSSEIHLQRLLGMSLCELWTKYLVAYFMFQQQLFSKVKKISWGFFCLFYLSDLVISENLNMQSITITFLNQLSLGIQTLQKCVLFMLQKTSLLIPPCVCQYATNYDTLYAEALNASLRLYLNQMS